MQMIEVTITFCIQSITQQSSVRMKKIDLKKVEFMSMTLAQETLYVLEQLHAKVGE